MGAKEKETDRVQSPGWLQSSSNRQSFTGVEGRTQRSKRRQAKATARKGKGDAACGSSQWSRLAGRHTDWSSRLLWVSRLKTEGGLTVQFLSSGFKKSLEFLILTHRQQQMYGRGQFSGCRTLTTKQRAWGARTK